MYNIVIKREVKSGKCKFCQQDDSIKKSHIIPKFFFDWLIKTSATGAIRSIASPNKREQDGLKVDLLCKGCEEEFSRFENSFKRNIFSKIANYQKQKKEIHFTCDDIKCIYSMLWRVLAYSYYYDKLNEFNKDELEKIPDFLDLLKQAIKEGTTKKARTYIIPLTKKVIIDSNITVTDFMYYDRNIGMDVRIYDNYERLIIYIKVPFVLIICELISCCKDKWIAPQLELTSKINIDDRVELPEYVKDLIHYFYKRYEQTNISESQQRVILQDLENANINSGTFKSLIK